MFIRRRKCALNYFSLLRFLILELNFSLENKSAVIETHTHTHVHTRMYTHRHTIHTHTHARMHTQEKGETMEGRISWSRSRIVLIRLAEKVTNTVDCERGYTLAMLYKIREEFVHPPYWLLTPEVS